MRFIPFISQFSNLQRVFVGGMVRGEVIHIPNRSYLWDDEGDVNRVLTLMDMISGAFRVGGVLPTGLQVLGLRCPYSGMDDEDNDDGGIRTCEVCERACQSLPLEQVAEFGNGGMLSDNINNGNFHLPRRGLNHVCLERSQIESITESRPGGNALLRSNARLMYLLGRGSVYEIKMDDSNIITDRDASVNHTFTNIEDTEGGGSSDESMFDPDDAESYEFEDSSSDEEMANEGGNQVFETPHGSSLYIVKYTDAELEELQRVLQYSGTEAARIPQEEVTRAIAQSFARDDKVPPSNQCYLSKRSLIHLRDTLGLSIKDKAFSTPDVKVGHSIQLAQAVADGTPIQMICITLLCRVLEKAKCDKKMHQAVVRMLVSNDIVSRLAVLIDEISSRNAMVLIGEMSWNGTNTNIMNLLDGTIRALVRSLGSTDLNIAHEATRTIGKVAMDSDTICRNEILEANAIYPLLMLMKRSRDIDVIGEVVWTLQNISKGFGRPGNGFNHLKICLEPLSEILLADKHKLKGDQSDWTNVQRYICSILYWICRYDSPNSQSRDALYTVMKTGVIPHLMNINIKEGASFLRLLVNHDKLWSLYHRRDLLPGLIPFLSSLNEMNKTFAFRAVCNSLSYAEKDYIPTIVTRLGRELPNVILLLYNRKDAWLSDKSAKYSKTLVCGGCIPPLCDMMSNGKDEWIVNKALKALQVVSNIHVICFTCNSLCLLKCSNVIMFTSDSQARRETKLHYRSK